MGNNSAHLAAAQYLKQVKEAVEHQKIMIEEHQKQAKKKKSKGSRTPKGTDPSSVPQVGLSHQNREKVTRNKMGTWSSTCGRQHEWYQTSSNSSESLSFTSSLVFENPGTQEEFPTLAIQTDKVYRRMSQPLLEQEALTIRRHSTGNTQLYILGQVIGDSQSPTQRPLPSIPGEESDTDYEDVDDEPEQRVPNFVHGNMKHREELRKTSMMFVRPVEELELKGTDKEWQQWIQIQKAGEDM